MSNKQNPDFIGSYKNALSEDECKTIIQYFEDSKEKSPGEVFDLKSMKPAVDKSRKDSMDLIVPWWKEDIYSTYLLEKALLKYSQKYREEYTGCDKISPWGPDNYYHIQKYLPNQGYHEVHCESGEKGTPTVLAWMFYLNTVTDGGGTRFPSYDLDVNAEEGKLLIWPAYFTHIHHGIVSKTQTKYIATGWFTYA
jgi:hypothetical protein